MTVLLKRPVPRRTLLRGLLNGAAVAVALPFLDCFLDSKGKALASGAPLPVRFGTWFWGLGFSPGHGIAPMPGQIHLQSETSPLEPHLRRISYFSGFNAALDGAANFTHYSGLTALRTGSAPNNHIDVPAPTLDILIAETIGKETRFPSLEMTCTGNPGDTYTARNSGYKRASDVSPLSLYARIFGPGFVDPNKGEFKPDPNVMVQRSVLTAINEQRRDFTRQIGAADRARLDEYFESVRQLETQLQFQMQEPAAMEACKTPNSPKDGKVSAEIDVAIANHRAMTQLLVLALACNQTKVFSMIFNDATSGLRKAGQAYTHHMLSHEEATDDKFGYQPEVHWFNLRCMEALASFIEAFAGVREGDGTLLEHALILAHSDTNNAQVHAIDSIPAIFAGTAGGRIKAGRHIVGNGDPITQVGLTAMQVMGVAIEKWGTKSLQTSKQLTDVLA